jgi:hypothetical protein
VSLTETKAHAVGLGRHRYATRSLALSHLILLVERKVEQRVQQACGGGGVSGRVAQQCSGGVDHAQPPQRQRVVGGQQRRAIRCRPLQCRLQWSEPPPRQCTSLPPPQSTAVRAQ